MERSIPKKCQNIKYIPSLLDFWKQKVPKSPEELRKEIQYLEEDIKDCEENNEFEDAKAKKAELEELQVLWHQIEGYEVVNQKYEYLKSGLENHDVLGWPKPEFETARKQRQEDIFDCQNSNEQDDLLKRIKSLEEICKMEEIYQELNCLTLPQDFDKTNYEVESPDELLPKLEAMMEIRNKMDVIAENMEDLLKNFKECNLEDPPNFIKAIERKNDLIEKYKSQKREKNAKEEEEKLKRLEKIQSEYLKTIYLPFLSFEGKNLEAIITELKSELSWRMENCDIANLSDLDKMFTLLKQKQNTPQTLQTTIPSPMPIPSTNHVESNEHKKVLLKNLLELLETYEKMVELQTEEQFFADQFKTYGLSDPPDFDPKIKFRNKEE